MVKYLIEGGFAAAFLGLFSLGTYARAWEYRQPAQQINGAVVDKIDPYHYRSDVGPGSSGFKVRIHGMSEPIDFPSDTWDRTVNTGDNVDLSVRKKFPLLGSGELDGLKIDDHK